MFSPLPAVEPLLLTLLLLLFLYILQASAAVSSGYLAAFRRLTADLESSIVDCQFSVEGMVRELAAAAAMHGRYTGLSV
jgi:hypothetical protein